MEIKQYHEKVKSIVNNVDGAWTDQWPSGTRFNNRYEIVFGQMDVTVNSQSGKHNLFLVLDTIPGKYSESLVEELTGLFERTKGKSVTGFFIKKGGHVHDAIMFRLYEKDMDSLDINKLDNFIKRCCEESSFKTESTR